MKKIEESKESDSKNQEEILKLESKLRATGNEVSQLQQNYEIK